MFTYRIWIFKRQVSFKGLPYRKSEFFVSKNKNKAYVVINNKIRNNI